MRLREDDTVPTQKHKKLPTSASPAYGMNAHVVHGYHFMFSLYTLITYTNAHLLLYPAEALAPASQTLLAAPVMQSYHL